MRAWAESSRTYFEVHLDVVQGGGQHTGHLLLHGERGITKKNLLASFLMRWEEENQLCLWKARKASPPPLVPVLAGLPGEGEVMFGWLYSGLLLWKNLAFFWMPPARSGRANTRTGLLQAAGSELLPLHDILTPSSCIPVLPSSVSALPVFMQGNSKWHLSMIPTGSRNHSLHPKWEFIMLCQERSVSRFYFFFQWSS